MVQCSLITSSEIPMTLRIVTCHFSQNNYVVDLYDLNKHSSLQKIAMRDFQESVTTGHTY